MLSLWPFIHFQRYSILCLIFSLQLVNIIVENKYANFTHASGYCCYNKAINSKLNFWRHFHTSVIHRVKPRFCVFNEIINYSVLFNIFCSFIWLLWELIPWQETRRWSEKFQTTSIFRCCGRERRQTRIYLTWTLRQNNLSVFPQRHHFSRGISKRCVVNSRP